MMQSQIQTIWLKVTSLGTQKRSLNNPLFHSSHWHWPCFFIVNFEQISDIILVFPKLTFRSSRLEVFCKKDVLRNFAKFKGKHLCQSPFFNKVAGLKPPTLLKKRPWHRCFPVNLAKFAKNTCFYRTSPVAASGLYRYSQGKTLFYSIQ